MGKKERWILALIKNTDFLIVNTENRHQIKGHGEVGRLRQGGACVADKGKDGRQLFEVQ